MLTPAQEEALKRVEPILREHFHSACLIIPCPGKDGEGEESDPGAATPPGDYFSVRFVGSGSWARGLLWSAYWCVFGGED